jgi:hypothetical protein
MAVYAIGDIHGDLDRLEDLLLDLRQLERISREDIAEMRGGEKSQE